MSAEATRGPADDAAELAELRRRAYGPQADIGDDPVAVARLDQLESRIRGRFADIDDTALQSIPAPAPASSAAEESGRRAPRWHSALLAATAAAALILGGIAWTDTLPADAVSGTAAAGSSPAPTIPIVEDHDWAASSADDYTRFLDTLRAELLEREGMDELADRVIRKQLRPYGSLYGHTVWAGSTTDGEYCMIIVTEPLPEIGCILTDEAYTSPLTIVLPAGYPDTAADTADEAALEPDAPISYTLLPGGTVVAEPSEARNPRLD